MIRSIRGLFIGTAILFSAAFLAGGSMSCVYAEPASSSTSLTDEDDNGYSSSSAQSSQSTTSQSSSSQTAQSTTSQSSSSGTVQSSGSGSSQTVKTEGQTISNDSSSHSSGMMYTGNKNIDYLAEVMVQAAGVKENMDDDTKVRLIYHYITVNFHHIHSGEPYTIYYDLNELSKQIKAFYKTTKKRVAAGEVTYTNKYTNMLKYLLKRGGECNAQAGAFALLVNHVGVESGVCHGHYLNRNGTAPGHYWNYAVVDGQTFYYDVDVELQNYGKGQGDYYWYKKTRKEAEETHSFS